MGPSTESGRHSAKTFDIGGRGLEVNESRVESLLVFKHMADVEHRDSGGERSRSVDKGAYVQRGISGKERHGGIVRVLQKSKQSNEREKADEGDVVFPQRATPQVACTSSSGPVPDGGEVSGSKRRFKIFFCAWMFIV